MTISILMNRVRFPRTVGDEVEFVWNLAHELRHVEQRRRWPMLIRAAIFVGYCLPHLPLEDVNISIPAELDAELVAWRTARHFFGVEAAGAYPKREARGGLMAANYKALLTHNLDEPYDVCEETVVLLRTHRERLIELQQAFPETEARTFDLDAVVQVLAEGANQCSPPRDEHVESPDPRPQSLLGRGNAAGPPLNGTAHNGDQLGDTP